MTGLTDDEIAGFATLLGGAGAETVTKLVGNAAVLFARHPDQWNKVLADRSLIAPAVEEVLRYPPALAVPGSLHGPGVRATRRDHPGRVSRLLITGAATRDERHYDEPDRFDIERPASLSLGFGYGIHSCLGAALARMESRIAIELMAERWPRFEIDESGLRRVNMSNVAGYSSVPLTVA